MPFARSRGRPRHPELFTPAEARLLPLIAEGLTNAEIAVRIGLSVHTVHSQVASMLAKSGATDRHELPRATPPQQPEQHRLFWPLAALRVTAGVALAGVATMIVLVVVAVWPNDDEGATVGGAGQPSPSPASKSLDATASSLNARPLDLPSLEPGAPCPVDQPLAVFPGAASTAGVGPAYVTGLVGGFSRESGGIVAKTLLIPEQTARQPILVRGRQMDGPGQVAFDDLAPRTTSLLVSDFNTTSGSLWFRVVGTVVSGEGCYALQLDSARYSEVIVFQVTLSGTGTPASAPPMASATELRSRPLRSVTFADDRTCPGDVSQNVNRAVGPAIGPGPVYLVGVARAGGFGKVPALSTAGTLPPQYAQWGSAKTIFVARPPNVGPLLFRGRRIGGDGEVAFWFTSDPTPELIVDSPLGSDAGNWYSDVFGTLVPTPGCYAIQVDGTRFSETIVFEASY
jgi:DNA-binding CsgD family transcriptional regulator